MYPNPPSDRPQRRLLALGLSHQTAPVALREKVAFGPERLPAALAELLARPGVEEAAVVSTCNRTEIYCSVGDGFEAEPARWLADSHGLTLDTLRSCLYQHHDGEAVRHLFRVATGLDSLVLGEPQILGQVKDAWQLAREAGGLRSGLDRMFQHGFAVAKRVRTDTEIGAHPVSVAFAGVRLAQQVFSDLKEASVLLIGAGETIELTARHLLEQKAKRLLIANRTLENAQALASRIGGYALPLTELGRHLHEADIVISATAAREPILRRADLAQALRQRRHRPMFLLDLAVPRDIAEDVATLEDVFLYTVDDLDQVIEENRRSRQAAAREAEAIIELQVEHFLGWWRAADRQGLIRDIRSQAERERDAVLARAQQMIAQGKPADEALRYLAHTLTNKLLHAPSARLRQAAQRGELELFRAAEQLFQGTEAGDSAGDEPTREPQ
ncbi:glutamyl-tRNA reductase [Aquimonas voraii]|uniref:Glutamyl-tRNA reductase n=1 Tax=Aquimonas voraii TaxID=265719 RepID=A0A1G6YDK0_9GAMM|nr:glutamyl-tRNA reductase [Aquimonas voraii]SDD88448.1 glutamyl-tRNA reductase [Aquimonas voraii]